MKISPLDIQQQQFKGKMFGGLDPDDVDAFLQMVAQEMEALIRENSNFKEQASRNVALIAVMEGQESQLRDAVLAAQKIAEEMKANAQKEATLLITEAELKGQIQELRRQKLQFETALKSLLETHSKMLSLNDE